MMCRIRIKDLRVSLVLYLLFGIIEASHFRGGYITWTPGTINQTNITYRVSFQNSGSHFCDQAIINSNSLVNGEGVLACQSGPGCTSNIVPLMSYYCVEFNTEYGTTVGERTVTHDLTPGADGFLRFGYSDCCFITLEEQSGSGYWRLSTMANLTTRIDTGQPNTSPNISLSTTIRVAWGVTLTLPIPVFDVDGDTIKCRWAKATPNDECADICETLSGSILDEDACILTYPANKTLGWYGVALQVEDFAAFSPSTPLSSVSLQFLILVMICPERPVIVQSNLMNGDSFDVNVNQTFTHQIIAQSANGTNCSISLIAMPTTIPGMTQSIVQAYGTPDQKQWSINIQWTPTYIQIGNQTLCIDATDTSALVSDMVCVHFVVRNVTTADTMNADESGSDFMEEYDWLIGLIVAIAFITAITIAVCCCCICFPRKRRPSDSKENQVEPEKQIIA